MNLSDKPAMNRAARVERILECMEQQFGHEFMSEPVAQMSGTAEFIPLWNAYRDRDAAEVLEALDRLCTSYWTPRATRDAEEGERDDLNAEVL